MRIEPRRRGVEAQERPPSRAQHAELGRRLAEDDLQPEDVTDWEAIKAAARRRWVADDPEGWQRGS